MSAPHVKAGGISIPCQHNGHTVCKTHYVRKPPGVLEGIIYAHHPNPNHGERLDRETVRCICSCHNKQLPPGSSTD